MPPAQHRLGGRHYLVQHLGDNLLLQPMTWTTDTANLATRGPFGALIGARHNPPEDEDAVCGHEHLPL